MELFEYFEKVAEGLKTLSQDVRTYMVTKKRSDEKLNTTEIEVSSQTDIEVHDQGDTVEVSFRSIMPRTVLRKSVEEVKEAQANPQVTMFTDKLNQIFE